MDAIQLLQSQVATAHLWLEGAVRTATDEELRWFPHGDAHPAGVCYAHAVAVEDMIVSRILTGEAPLAATLWEGRTGLSEPMPDPGPDWRERSAHWTRALRIAFPELRSYAEAVYAKTESYLASLHPDNLDYEVDLSGIGMRKQPLAWVISTLVIGHLHDEIGEISVVKALQGLPGFPVGH